MQEQKDDKHRKQSTVGIEDEVNYQEFIETQEEFAKKIQGSEEGVAILKSSELVDKEEVPEEYSRNYNTLTPHYFKFQGTFVDLEKDIDIYCPAWSDGRTIEFAMEWAEADSIKDLSGSKVPVRHMDNDVYRIEAFRDKSPIPYPNSVLKYLGESDLILYKNGSWEPSIKLNIMELSLMLSTMLLFLAAPIIVG